MYLANALEEKAGIYSCVPGCCSVFVLHVPSWPTDGRFLLCAVLMCLSTFNDFYLFCIMYSVCVRCRFFLDYILWKSKDVHNCNQNHFLKHCKMGYDLPNMNSTIFVSNLLELGSHSIRKSCLEMLNIAVLIWHAIFKCPTFGMVKTELYSNIWKYNFRTNFHWSEAT